MNNQRMSMNTITTNVPGPQFTLYCLGRKMLKLYPYVMLPKNIRVATAIFSYDVGVYFGVNGDYDAAPDIDVVCDGITSSLDQLAAAVVFYGPPPPVEQLANLNAPLLGLFAEQDRGITGRIPAVLTALNEAQKPYELHIYQNARHAFHNDTGAAYEPTAACDAWQKTLTFFARHLNR